MTAVPSSAVACEELPSELGDDEVDALLEPFDETYDDREPRDAAGDDDGASDAAHAGVREVRLEDCWPPRRAQRHVSFGDGKGYTVVREEM